MSSPVQQQSTARKSAASHTFRKVVADILRVGVPLAFTVLLVVWLFHKINFRAMMDVIRQGVDYRWILLMMVSTVLSHIIRGYRWGMQLRQVGINCSMADLCAAVFGNYALNLVIPRIGEVWRSAFIARRKNRPFSTVLGTVFGDRLVDGMTVVTLIAFTLVATRGAIHDFIRHYHLGRDVLDLIADPLTWCVLFTIAVTIVLLCVFSHRLKFVANVDRWLLSVWQGIRSLAGIRRLWLFLLLTLGIWVCYFSQIYLCFFAFGFTREIVATPGSDYGLTAALVAFVFSTLSMAIPSNGGLGPWNLAIIFGLSLFGVTTTEGAAFSMVVWSFQSLMLVILGIATAIYITLTRPKKT